jgi:ribosomal protein S18 acetylase RimI-like enzyme
MELANQPMMIRAAEQSDAALLTRLLRETIYQHIHPDWRLPVDLLGDPGFLLLYEEDETDRRQQSLLAALAITADPPPTAWVRVAIARQDQPPGDRLALLWERLLPTLTAAGIIQVGWFAVEKWAEEWLPRLGFQVGYQVETYKKAGLALPDLSWPQGVEIRPAEESDLPAVAALDEAAFEPLWRYSAAGLTRAWQSALSFDLAFYDGRLAGFQFSEQYDNVAHLSRMAVHPDFQGQGIGRALLRHTLEGYRAHNVELATLNTQADNWPSKKLYRKFAFQPAPPSFAVWVCNLTRAQTE